MDTFYGKSLFTGLAAGVGGTLFVALGFALWLSLPSYSPLAKEPPRHPLRLVTASAAVELEPVLREYIEVINGCGPYFEGGACVKMYAGPGEEYRAITQLRYGVVLEVKGREVYDGRTWYKIARDENLRYPERASGDWYVPEGNVRGFFNPGPQKLAPGEYGSTTKRILVDRSDQMLYAYDGELLYTKLSISTGIQLTPTPSGYFTIYKKTPSRYMQGPILEISDKFYDLPGVPWNLYFTKEGAVIHGAYWHDKFGRKWSNGCVNLPVGAARSLYEWADLGTQVHVRD